MPILIGVVAGTVLTYLAVRRLPSVHRAKLLNSLDEFSAVAGLLTRAFTAVDAVRLIAQWQQTWVDGQQQRLPTPPITVPVPVKSNQRDSQVPAAPANPPAGVAGPKQFDAFVEF